MWAENCGRGRIRTTVGASRLIYSQLPLSTRAPAHVCLLAPSSPAARTGVVLSTAGRADDRTRTDNLLFTRQLLCRLSYAGDLVLLGTSAAHENSHTQSGIIAYSPVRSNPRRLKIKQPCGTVLLIHLAHPDAGARRHGNGEQAGPPTGVTACAKISFVLSGSAAHQPSAPG